MIDAARFAVGAAGGQFQGSLLGMILDAGLMVQFVLLILLCFSVVSWAIILMKLLSFRKVKQENEQFFETYMRLNRLADVFSEAKKFKNSGAAEVFRAGYAEFLKATRTGKIEDTPNASPALRSIDTVERALGRAADNEAHRMESLLGFLATTGNACPFIGLFGTVWGIMDTFKGIGARGSATLAIVAPGISEALIATAAGLAAAIPAVIFYNYFTNRVRDHHQEMESFASELTNFIERNYLR